MATLVALDRSVFRTRVRFPPGPLTGDTMVFVFGSNLAGIHGAGAARFALENHGAVWGQGIGLQGNSYGIPTKDENIETLPLEEIDKHVKDFLDFARQNTHMEFNVTRIGCGLAGYKDHQIAPMFNGAPDNCTLPVGWKNYAPLVQR